VLPDDSTLVPKHVGDTSSICAYNITVQSVGANKLSTLSHGEAKSLFENLRRRLTKCECSTSETPVCTRLNCATRYKTVIPTVTTVRTANPARLPLNNYTRTSRFEDRDSVAGMLKCVGLETEKSWPDSRQRQDIFSSVFTVALGSTQLPTQCVSGMGGIKLPGNEAEHLPPSTA
jgi:hypothetical protein